MKENEEPMKSNEGSSPLIENNSKNIELTVIGTFQEPTSKKADNKASINTVISEEDYDERVCTMIPDNFFSFNFALYIFLVLIFVLTSINFSYLTLPYTIISVFVCLLPNIPEEKERLYNVADICRDFSFPVICVYSLGVIIFKLIMIIKSLNEDPFIEENAERLINLGVTYISVNKTSFNLICTIGPDIIFFIYSLFFSLIGIIYLILCPKESPIVYDIKGSYGNLTAIQLRRHIEISYFFLILFSYFCPSFFSISNLVAIQICMGLMAFRQNEIFTIKYYLTKILIKLMHFQFSIYLIAINILNISSFQKNYLVNEEEKIKDHFTCENTNNFWTKLGISCTYDYDESKIIYRCGHYVYTIICYLSLENLVRLITNGSINPDEFDDINEETLKNQFVDEKEEISLIVKAVKNFLTLLFFYLENDQIIPHVCRILAIIHIYYCHNVYSLAIFIWLFFSFVCNDVRSTRLLCIIFLIPIMIMSSLCFILSIILFDDNDNKKRDVYTFFGLKRIGEHYYFYYVFCHIIFLLMITFLYSIKTKNKNKSELLRMSKGIKNAIVDNTKNQITNSINTEETNFEEDLKNMIQQNIDTENNKKKKKIEGLTLFNLIVRFLLGSIDKFNLIVVYLVSVSSINVVHLLLVLLFIVNVIIFINPSKQTNKRLTGRRVVNKITLIFIQLSFIFEFLLDLIKFFRFDDITKEEQQEIMEIMKFLVNYNEDIEGSSSEILLYIIVYCYYFQYQIYLIKTTETTHTDLKKLLSNDDICIYNYVKINISFIFYIYNILAQLIKQIYIWILISAFIFFFCYFELNVLFSIKLGLFLIVVYLFLRVILKTINKKEDNYDLINTVMIWTFLMFSIINTISVYLYQFIRHDYFYNKIQNTFLIDDNLSFFGFKKYTGNLRIKFLPHFAVNFLAILFLDEMESFKKIKEYEIKTSMNKLKKDNNIEEDNSKIRREGSKREKDNNTEVNYSLQYEECKNRIFLLKINLIAINFVLFFTKIYWMFLFLLICILFNSYYFSFSMVIYIVIFGVTFIRMFYKQIQNFNKYQKSTDNQAELIEKLNIIKFFREFSFKVLVGYSFILFMLYYIYGIYDISVSYCNPQLWIGCDNQNNPNNTISDDDLEAKNKDQLIKAYSYIFGIYFNTQKEGILSVAWVHLFLCFLFCFDVYIQKIENYFMGLKMKSIDEHDKKTLESFGLRQKSLEAQVDLLIPKKEQRSSQQLTNFYARSSLRTQIGSKLVEKLSEVIKIYNLYEMKRRRNKEIYKIMSSLKYISEQLIIFLLISEGILKLNIWTAIYLSIAVFIMFRKKTIETFFRFYMFNILSIILQTILYVSNTQKETSPKENENTDIFDIIHQQLGIPWYKGRWAFFFGIGVNRSQVRTIYYEFIVSMIFYIYLDFFTDSKFFEYSNDEEIDQDTNKKILLSALYENPSLNNREINLSRNDFLDIKKIMKANTYIGNISSLTYNDFQLELDKLKKRKINNTKMMTKEEDNIEKKKLLIKLNQKTKQIFYGLEFIKDIIYLSSHNFILIIDAIICMLVPGALSIIYILFFLYFISHSNLFVQGRKYYYAHSTKYFRIFILVDICFQLIIQFIELNQKSIDFLSMLGIFSLVDKKDNSISIQKDEIYKVVLKALCFFFLSLQILIYGSRDFFQFYFIYLVTLKVDYKKISKLNAFKFNNERINVMNKSLKLKEKTYKTMMELQGSLIEWQKIFNTKKEDSNSNKDSEKLIDEKKQGKEYVDEEEAKNTIKKWIMDKLLIKVYLYIHKFCSPYQNLGNNEMNEYEKDIIQGRAKPITYIEFLIELYLDAFSPFKLTDQGLLIVASILDGSLEKKKKELDIIIKTKENEISDLEAHHEKMKTKSKELINAMNDIDQKIKKLEEAQNEANNDWDLLGLYNSNILSNDSVIDLTQKIPKNNLVNPANELLINKIEAKVVGDDEKEGEKNYDKLLMIYKKAKDIIREEEKKITKDIKKYEDLRRREEKHNQIKYLDDENLSIKRKKETNKIEPSDMKYKKFQIMQTKTLLFTRYLKNHFIFICILLELKSCLSFNFHWFCYFIMILNHMVNPCLTTFYYPLSIFLYALLEYPRPKKIYWKVCLYYTFYVLLLKIIFASKLFDLIIGKNNFKEFLDTLKAYRVGFQYSESTFSREYFSYIIYDMLTIAIVMININLLGINGLWDKREQEIESIYSAMERVSISSSVAIKDDQIKDFNKEFFGSRDNSSPKKHLAKRRTEIYEKKRRGARVSIMDDLLEKKKTFRDRDQSVKIANINDNDENEKLNKEIKNKYYDNILPRIRNEKPGDEFYHIYTAAMIVICTYILFFFNYMIRDENYGELSMDVQQFNGLMVIYFIIHVIILICDRAIVLLQNRNDNKFKYYLYSHEDINDLKKIRNFKKKTKEEKKEYFKQNVYEVEDELIQIYPKKKRWQNHSLVIPIQHFSKLREKYIISYKQIEEFNKPLFYKYLLHFVITVFVHVIAFIYFPFRGNINLGKEMFCQEGEKCNDFVENPSLVVFYIIYLCYLIPSSLQIKYGFLDMKKKSLLRRSHSEYNNIVIEIFQKIPFLNEIKNIFDWTMTNTSLDLDQWIQFESIYDAIYNTYCGDKSILGEKIPKIEKIKKGGTLSFILISALVGPLFIFSSLNPTNVINSLDSAKLKVDLSFEYKNSTIKKYTLFENSRDDTISPISDTTLSDYNYTVSVKTRSFPKDQIQTVKFYETSDTNWDLVLPHITTIIQDLSISDSNNKVESINLVFQIQFTRPLPAEAQTVSDEINKVIYSRKKDSIDSEGAQKITTLRNALSRCIDTNITFQEFYSPSRKLSSSTSIIYLNDSNHFFDLDIQLGFEGCNNSTGKNNYLQSYFTLEVIKYNDSKTEYEPLFFHIFSEKISPTTSNYSVFAFYTAVILVFGEYVRDFCSGGPEGVMLNEMPEPKKLVNLCRGINIARNSNDFRMEKKLYYILIEFLREPTYLLEITKSSVENFEEAEANSNIITTDNLD